MSDLAKKLQLKSGGFRVINAPPGLKLDLPLSDGPEAAVIVFARDSAELEREAGPAIEAALADRLAWIAYPKAGQLGTDLNRDILWNAVAPKGVRGVRQISIDEVWSAMRFRPQ